MGDHFVLLVDRLLTESTLEAAILSKNLLPSESTIENKKASFSINIMDTSVGSSTMKSEECRICHDEDEDSNMDTPCSCRGSLKYAHPKCVQRWCNEKGDTICEICHQFMVLLVLRHTLPFILYGAGEYSISLFMVRLHILMFFLKFSILRMSLQTFPLQLFMLRTIGILLLIYIMVKAFTAIQRPRPRQGPPILPAADSEEENELPRIQPESHLINVP
ncbi:putative E3 ubiquitin ligase SUD1 isoform X7 [Primulina tabacum]|uniref:putative E3 ubiquitin ligase SUD1 isoform X7 n=1 Tax=Primulina tabacum TaxID=48773 RepID=UPI003F5A5042